MRRITEAVEKQRTRLEERELALESSTSAAAAAAAQQLAEAIRRAERSEQRVRDLEQQVSDLEVRPAVSAPPPRAPAPPIEDEPLAGPAPPPRVLDLDGEPTYTLQRLERLVREAEQRGEPQAEEWALYLPLLREQAEPDGRLPAQFASLVDSIFAA